MINRLDASFFDTVNIPYANVLLKLTFALANTFRLSNDTSFFSNYFLFLQTWNLTLQYLFGLVYSHSL